MARSNMKPRGRISLPRNWRVITAASLTTLGLVYQTGQPVLGDWRSLTKGKPESTKASATKPGTAKPKAAAAASKPKPAAKSSAAPKAAAKPAAAKAAPKPAKAAPALVDSLTRDAEKPTRIVGRQSAASVFNQLLAVFDVPCQGGHERVEFDDGRAYHFGSAEEPCERACIGRGSQSVGQSFGRSSGRHALERRCCAPKKGRLQGIKTSAARV